MDLQVPQHVLRFWETKFSQIKPLKRGGGRRYYRPEDVDLLRGIRTLLYDDGYTIKGVQKVLRDNGARHVVGTGRGMRPEPVQKKSAPTRVPANDPAPAKAQPAGDGEAEGLRKALEEVLAELEEIRRMMADDA